MSITASIARWFCKVHPHTMLVKRDYKHGGPPIWGDHENPMLAKARYCPACFREWRQKLKERKAIA